MGSMAGLTVKERQHLAREDAIVETAHDILAEQGYEKMNMDDLAKRVGVAKATLYQHFPSKEDVLVGVIVRLMRLGESQLFSEASADLSPLTQLDRGLRACLNSRIQLWKGNVAMQNPMMIKSHPRYREQYNAMFERLTTLIEQAKAQGEINPALITPVIVHTVMWLFRIDYETLTHLPTCTAQQALDSLVTMVINGIKMPAILNAEPISPTPQTG